MSFRFALAYIGPQSFARLLKTIQAINHPLSLRHPMSAPSSCETKLLCPTIWDLLWQYCVTVSLHPRLADFPALSRYVGCIEERWNCHGRNPGDKIVAYCSKCKWQKLTKCIMKRVETHFLVICHAGKCTSGISSFFLGSVCLDLLGCAGARCYCSNAQFHVSDQDIFREMPTVGWFRPAMSLPCRRWTRYSPWLIQPKMSLLKVANWRSRWSMKRSRLGDIADIVRHSHVKERPCNWEFNRIHDKTI